MNAKGTSFIARCGNDAATFSMTDGDRLATKIWMISLFHGCVERVHVDVDDLPLARGFGHFAECAPTQAPLSTQALSGSTFAAPLHAARIAPATMHLAISVSIVCKDTRMFLSRPRMERAVMG